MKFRDRLVPVSVISDGMMYKAGGVLDGYHRVPYVNANSDGDFEFNLGNFENDWNDDNCLLCFCHSLISYPSLSKGGMSLYLFLDAFLPSAKHPSYFIQ
jgi:hypothetical protein